MAGAARGKAYSRRCDAPPARYEVAAHTFVLLWEVIARLDLPELKEIPDGSVYVQDDDKTKMAYWRIPHTEIIIMRVEDGLRKSLRRKRWLT